MLIEPAGDDGRQQRARVLVVEPLEPQFRQARQLALLARLADGEHDRHPLREQPARHESEHLAGGVVEPLEVVHETQQRLRLRHLRQETERRQAHEEPVASSAGREPERHPERVLLRLRERFEAIEQRHAELMQTRERQFHLRLDAGDLDDPEPGGLAGDETQQRRLAHARLATDDEHAAAAPARALEQPLQRLALGGSAAERRRTLLGGHGRHTVPAGVTDQGLPGARRAPDRGTVSPSSATHGGHHEHHRCEQ